MFIYKINGGARENLYTGFCRISEFVCDQNNGRELYLSEKNYTSNTYVKLPHRIPEIEVDNLFKRIIP